MKVVLIQGKYRNSWESQALGFIGAYLHLHHRELQISFHHGSMDPEERIVADCVDANIVGFSATSPTFDWCRSLASKIKAANPGVWIVVGGYHSSVLGAACLSSDIDQVVQGEGEHAMLSIIEGNRAPIVQGFTMRFSELPWVDRDLIRNERHVEVAQRDTGKRITSFQAHRGCPFRCRFCADGKRKALYGGIPPVVRHREVDSLVAEMHHVTEEYALDLIKFCDATWNIRESWVESFCLHKMGQGFTTPFFANIHARVTSQKMFDLMAAAGCTDIGLGIESGSERVLSCLGKGTDKQMIRDAVFWAKAAGIHVRGYFILGMPEETEDDLRQTEEFAAELELDEYGFTILCPYPGTDFYDPIRMSSIDWAKTDEYSNDFWKSDNLSNQDLKEWQAKLSSKFASRLTWHQKQKGMGVD